MEKTGRIFRCRAVVTGNIFRAMQLKFFCQLFLLRFTVFFKWENFIFLNKAVSCDTNMTFLMELF